MQAMKVAQRKAQYTSEFKQEAVRLVKSGKSALSVAKILNMPHQTLENWLRLDHTAKLVGVDHQPVMAEQLELARLRAENARLKSESGYYHHKAHACAQKRIHDQALLTHIRAIYAEVKGEYGWPRIWRALMAKGLTASKEHVRKLMQLNGIYARGKRKFVVTTDSKHNLPIAPNARTAQF